MCVYDKKRLADIFFIRKFLELHLISFGENTKLIIQKRWICWRIHIEGSFPLKKHENIKFPWKVLFFSRKYLILNNAEVAKPIMKMSPGKKKWRTQKDSGYTYSSMDFRVRKAFEFQADTIFSTCEVGKFKPKWITDNLFTWTQQWPNAPSAVLFRSSLHKKNRQKYLRPYQWIASMINRFN